MAHPVSAHLGTGLCLVLARQSLAPAILPAFKPLYSAVLGNLSADVKVVSLMKLHKTSLSPQLFI